MQFIMVKNFFVTAGLAACFFLRSLEALAASGNTIEVKNGSAVPSGWVITQVLVNTDWIITDLNGRNFRDTVQVINGSPIPNGWVVTTVIANSGHDWIIKNLNNGYYGATEEITG